jgi:hypothetical protein
MNLKRNDKLKKQYTRSMRVYMSPLKNTVNTNVIGIFLFLLTIAYDVINHRILLAKLNAFGVKGVANCCASYLSRQRQVTELNHYCNMNPEWENMFQPQEK